MAMDTIQHLGESFVVRALGRLRQLPDPAQQVGLSVKLRSTGCVISVPLSIEVLKARLALDTTANIDYCDNP